MSSKVRSFERDSDSCVYNWIHELTPNVNRWYLSPNPSEEPFGFDNMTMQYFKFASLLFFLDPVILIYVIQVHVLYSNPLQCQKEPDTLEQRTGDAFYMYLVCTTMTHRKTIFQQFFLYFQVSNTLTFTYVHYACKCYSNQLRLTGYLK